MDCKFKTETIHDLRIHKEFATAFHCSLPSLNVFYTIMCPLQLWYMTLFHSMLVVAVYLIGAAAVLIPLYLNQKRGDVDYRRMLSANAGRPQHSVLYITEDSIHSFDRNSENKYSYTYDQFKGLIETKELLILTMPYKLCLVLQKSWLIGGTPEELKAFLFSKCTNIKKKKPLSTGYGKWIYRIYLGIMVLGICVALVNFPGFSLVDRLSGKLHNDMSYQEMAAELEPLGITISPRTIEELEAYDAEYAPGKDFYDVYVSESKILDLLYWEGSGVYDEETWEWTPSTSGIYWFDAEAWNVDTIYTDFLAGVSAMDEELNFSNIQEDYSRADIENGTGTVSISFAWMGDHHQMDANYYYDWFDTSVLANMRNIINTRSAEKQLYYAYDGGQGYFLYYGTPEQASQFERLTGIYFADDYFAFS